ncbi:MAG: two-component system, OmpR family, response regulator [Actinomycetota bacterium]|nr:two-component system, OmpR family, response regulator [Actinomycetota bacterium]
MLVDVVLLRWPHEADRRIELAAQGLPRLLLVEDDAEPPMPEDCLEDWVRVPASETDVKARVVGLSVRAEQHRSAVPVLDEHGMLRFGASWVSLPPVESRITAALVSRLGAVVRREELAEAGWPDGAPGRNALDVHVLRIRRRLSPLGLAIRTVRSRGYLLEAAGVDAGDEEPAQAHA